MNAATPDERPVAGCVRLTREGGVAWLALDNPRKLNAISLPMWQALADALRHCEQDAAVRCIVIRGAGDKAFCSGADVAEKQGVAADQADADDQLALATIRAIQDMDKPVIAMLSGYCLGAGMAIALACDIRVAAAGASFGIPAARLGLAYYFVQVKRLTEVVGAARARQMLYTADRYQAERALEFGLVNELVAGDELLPFVSGMAARIAGNAPLTIAAAKSAVAAAVGQTPQALIAACDARVKTCLASADYVEGRLAFREKRAPVFQGR
ncbi:MAG TPA: enoyl-CoA hydratase [Ramlibacter sp.]|nr:enoyl-CoA hydratase [Ramlibacter sp.]